MTLEYYLECEPILRLACGPASVCGIAVEKEIGSQPAPAESRVTTEILDSYLTNSRCVYIHYYVEPDRIQLDQKKIRHVVECIAARLYFKTFKRPEAYIRTTRDVPNTPLHKLEDRPLSLGSWLCREINNHFRLSLINTHYKHIYKNYQLTKNLGYITRSSIASLLEHGFVDKFHYDHVLNIIPRFAVLNLSECQPTGILEDYIPRWWSGYRTDEEFHSLLAPSQQKQLSLILNGNCSDAHRSWLSNNCDSDLYTNVLHKKRKALV